MNILITGANGQLGNEMRIVAEKQTNHCWLFTDVAELDITDRDAIRRFVAKHNTDAIVNCAAYTNVDRAEEDEQSAYMLNAKAAENLAIVAEENKARLIHISTDYVFDGKSYLPYRETDRTCPQTAYGRTKLTGEELIRKISASAIIIRTSWLYSSFGNNFVKTMLRLGNEHESLSVVYDQIGTPTYAADLAKAIYTILEKTFNETGKCVSDGATYHFSNLGVCSWYDFAVEIHRLAGIRCQVNPIRSEQYPAKTPRPHYSVLDKQKIKDDFGLQIPHWTKALACCMEKLQY